MTQKRTCDLEIGGTRRRSLASALVSVSLQSKAWRAQSGKEPNRPSIRP